MKNKFFYSSIVIVVFCICSSCVKSQDADKLSSNHTNDSTSIYKKGNSSILKNDLEYKDEEFDFLPTSKTNQIISHRYYKLSYQEEFEQAEWVAYELKKSYIKNSDFKRPFFIEDSKVKSGSANWKNYKNSGFDKGHLCPAGDMEFAFDAYNDTFLTSNIAPQIHEFNNGVWNRLEQKVRYWAVKYDGIYVITGGVLKSSLETIGKEKVSVPEFFYKILLDDSGENTKMIGFLVPNSESKEPLYSFVVSVDLIEKMTGIDFFPKLENNVESHLEKSTDYKNWSFK